MTPEQPLGAVEGPGDTVARQISPRVVGFAVFFLVLVALATLSWDDVSEPRYEHIDFAANSILIDEAMSLDLLHGNYSRTGFYHPGPAFLYVQAGSQLAFHELLGVVPTPYNSHLLGIFILNAAVLALSAGIVYRGSGSLWSVGFLIVAAFAYSLLFDSVGLGGLLSSTWMPHVYVAPYLLLIISAASVCVGHAEDLWVFALASGLLVHGHVSFFLPVLVFDALVATIWIRRHKGSWLRAIPLPIRTATAIVLGLFILPLVLQLVTDFPGQFDSYLRYIRETDLPPRGIGTVARFVAQYWGFGAAWIVLIPALVLAVSFSTYYAAPGPTRDFRLALISAGLVASATTAIYAFSGVDDFTHMYLALFYVAVPIVFWTVLGINLTDRWTTGRPVPTVALAITMVFAWLVILIQPASGSLYMGSDVGDAYDALGRFVGADEPISISFTEHNDWAVTVGILEQARRDGRPACVRVGPGILEVLFAVENICAEDTGDRAEVLVTALAGQSPQDAVLAFDGPSYDLWILNV